MNEVTCPICGEFDADDYSDLHDACDIAEMRSWNAGFGVTYTGEEPDVVAVNLAALGRTVLGLTLSIAGAGVMLGLWIARKFLGKDRV